MLDPFLTCIRASDALRETERFRRHYMSRTFGLTSCRRIVKCSSLPTNPSAPEMARKLKILALHSFRTSGATFALQVQHGVTALSWLHAVCGGLA